MIMEKCGIVFGKQEFVNNNHVRRQQSTTTTTPPRMIEETEYLKTNNDDDNIVAQSHNIAKETVPSHAIAVLDVVVVCHRVQCIVCRVHRLLFLLFL